ncbi:MAG TPA: FAD-dependent oxidoreductase, partial [Bacteroidales bacterium]|nr:FAD-dependent oxidoreductase [Bacteroidales bacterium]
MAKTVIITGAGLAGMATALRLAKKGYKVEILEKNSQPGGRLNQLKKDGFTFDTGPSFFSMSYEFTDFAKECNISLPFRYYSLDPLYTVSFKNSDRVFRLYKDLAKLAAEFRDIEPDFEERMNRYLKKSGSLYHDTNVVIKNNYDSLLHYFLTLPRVGPAHIGTIFRSF